MGKVRLTAGGVLVVLLFIFALFNSGPEYVSDVRFFFRSWTITEVPVWGIIYIALILGAVIGYFFLGGHRRK